MRMLGNNLTGRGTIKLGKGKKLTGIEQMDIGANDFGLTQMFFGDITDKKVLLRNNYMQLGADSLNFLAGIPQQCDDAGSGQDVGCSSR